MLKNCLGNLRVTRKISFVQKISDSKIIPAKAIAFIEFEDDSEASIALKAMNGFKYTPEQALKVSYAKM